MSKPVADMSDEDLAQEIERLRDGLAAAFKWNAQPTGERSVTELLTRVAARLRYERHPREPGS